MKIIELDISQSSISTEILAGLTTFLACAYIIVVNPAILSKAGMPFNAVCTATVLVSFFSSVMMGIFANNPIVLAPGMGLNAFFTFSLVLTQKIPFPVALGAVFWSGVLFLFLSLFKIRDQIANSIPQSLRLSMAGGIGLFIALIGMENAHFIVAHPATLVTRGNMDASTICFILGLIFTSVLTLKKLPGALIIGIIFTTLISSLIGRVVSLDTAPIVTYKGIYSAPDFSLMGVMDLKNSFSLSFVPIIFSFLFTDLFDSLASFFALAYAGNLFDKNGNIRNLRRSLIVDALSTLISGPLGTSSGTSYIESAAGIEQGGRTGLVAIVAGFCFLPFMFFSPLLSLIPLMATSPILVLVGLFMCVPLKNIDWSNFEEALPCFLSLILIPFTYSISNGILWGILFYSLLKIFNNKWKEITPTLWVINLLSLLSLVVYNQT